MRPRPLLLAVSCLVLCALARADAALHPLWEVHGRHNTVYLLGSIHVLRPSDYPLPAAVQDAYGNAKALVMEVNPDELDAQQVQGDLLTAAQLPDGKTLSEVLGAQRYERATALARDAGVDLKLFDNFAPWFAAEAVSQLQLAKLGFEPTSGVDMYLAGLARKDGKPVDGLETVRDQLALFQALSLEEQAKYLLASLEDARELPAEVNAMVHAWQRGDMAWFEEHMKSELGDDPKLYDSFLLSRNRKWVPKIEALLNEDRNYLVIVGTAHLAGRGGVIDLLKKDGIGATQK
jgi:uncharacterized protein YbaP (TraB family)